MFTVDTFGVYSRIKVSIQQLYGDATKYLKFFDMLKIGELFAIIFKEKFPKGETQCRYNIMIYKNC